MVSCQLVEGEMYSCLYEKEKNKWKSAGRDSYSERKVRCRVAFHFLRREYSSSGRLRKNKILSENKEKFIKR